VQSSAPNPVLPSRFLSSLGLILGLSFAAGVSAGDFEHIIPLDRQKSGNYYITGTITDTSGAGTDVQFMVDTGAGMVTLAESTFKSLSRDLRVKPSRRVAARMADGRTRSINVYEIARFSLGKHCEIGPTEVAVIPGATNNILGLNVLNRAAPFAIFTSPPSLALSVCSSLVHDEGEPALVFANFE